MPENSKEAILNNIRAGKRGAAVPLPDTSRFGTVYDDKIAVFQSRLHDVGAVFVECDTEDIAGVIRERYPDAKRIASLMKHDTLANIDLETIQDPHELENLDLAVFEGVFGVAENGAIWIENEDNRHRALYFIARHIVIVLPKAEIVDNMHQAYERIDLSHSGFGTFISGPSKTADIEQALVIGAHGPESLCVVLV